MGAAPCPSYQQLQGIIDPTDPCQNGGASLETGCFDYATGAPIDCNTGVTLVPIGSPCCLDGSCVCDANGNPIGTPGSTTDPGAGPGTSSTAVCPNGDSPGPNGCPTTSTGTAGTGSVGLLAGIGNFVGGILRGVGLAGTPGPSAGGINTYRSTTPSNSASVLGGSSGVIIVVVVLLVFVLVRKKEGA